MHLHDAELAYSAAIIANRAHPTEATEAARLAAFHAVQAIRLAMTVQSGRAVRRTLARINGEG